MPGAAQEEVRDHWAALSGPVRRRTQGCLPHSVLPSPSPLVYRELMNKHLTFTFPEDLLGSNIILAIASNQGPTYECSLLLSLQVCHHTKCLDLASPTSLGTSGSPGSWSTFPVTKGHVYLQSCQTVASPQKVATVAACFSVMTSLHLSLSSRISVA